MEQDSAESRLDYSNLVGEYLDKEEHSSFVKASGNCFLKIILLGAGASFCAAFSRLHAPPPQSSVPLLVCGFTGLKMFLGPGSVFDSGYFFQSKIVPKVLVSQRI